MSILTLSLVSSQTHSWRSWGRGQGCRGTWNQIMVTTHFLTSKPRGQKRNQILFEIRNCTVRFFPPLIKVKTLFSEFFSLTKSEWFWFIIEVGVIPNLIKIKPWLPGFERVDTILRRNERKIETSISRMRKLCHRTTGLLWGSAPCNEQFSDMHLNGVDVGFNATHLHIRDCVNMRWVISVISILWWPNCSNLDLYAYLW